MGKLADVKRQLTLFDKISKFFTKIIDKFTISDTIIVVIKTFTKGETL